MFYFFNKIKFKKTFDRLIPICRLASLANFQDIKLTILFKSGVKTSVDVKWLIKCLCCPKALKYFLIFISKWNLFIEAFQIPLLLPSKPLFVIYSQHKSGTPLRIGVIKKNACETLNESFPLTACSPMTAI